MDRHVKWLRRRIIASVATQTAETFAIAAVLAFVFMQWRTDQGPLTALFWSVVVAQLVAGARIGHAMGNNPLTYVSIRRYVDQPITYRVSQFQSEEQAHPAIERFPEFVPVATIRGHDLDQERVFDIYRYPSRLVAASVCRASGSVSLISSLADGRILVTSARSMPPHECLVMNLAEDDSSASVIATHHRVIAARPDIAELASSAHQVVLDLLAVEYDSYLALGPTLSPFLDLEPAGTSWLRLVARIKPAELSELPVRLGPDLRMPNAPVSAPAPATATGHLTVPTELCVPKVIAPQIAAPRMVAVEIVAPTIAVLTPHVFEAAAAHFGTEGEPITAEVAAVVFTQEAAAIEASGFIALDPNHRSLCGGVEPSPAAEAPLDLVAAVTSAATVPIIDVVEAPALPVVAELVAAEMVVAEPVPVVFFAPEPVLTDHVSSVDPVLVPNLDAALGRSEELSPTRPGCL
jgi:hypothetical protein